MTYPLGSEKFTLCNENFFPFVDTSINSNVSFDYYHSLYSNSIITLNSPIGYTMSGSYDKATASCSISL